jgi:uncharacterized protein YecT (DUF1311 family)
MGKAFLAAVFVGLLTTTGAYAADKCGAARTADEISKCADGDLKVLDDALNKAYAEIEHRLANKHDARSALIAAERAWVHFRDSECKFSAAGVDGGSVYASVVMQCTADLTAKRIADLRTYLHCEEGDLACPVPAAD